MSTRQRPLVGLAALGAVIVITPGCVGLSVAAMSAIEAAVEDRSAGDIGQDFTLRSAVVGKIFETMGDDVVSINVNVYEQDVMLTGAVQTAAKRSKAGELARGFGGVKEVYNQIMVIGPSGRSKNTGASFFDDMIIEHRLYVLLFDDPGVNVTNFQWRSVRGHVFLFGRALGPAEHQRATTLARGIPGVASVTNIAKIRPKVVDGQAVVTKQK